jgi:hypothetical protein
MWESERPAKNIISLTPARLLSWCLRCLSLDDWEKCARRSIQQDDVVELGPGIADLAGLAHFSSVLREGISIEKR